MKIPKNLATCADKLYETQQKRLELNREARKLEAIEKELKAHLIDNLPKSEAQGVQGKLARVTIVKSVKPVIKDQDTFRKYLNRTKRFDLAYNLQPSPVAIREMWDNGKTIPGVESFTVVTVSINKV